MKHNLVLTIAGQEAGAKQFRIKKIPGEGGEGQQAPPTLKQQQEQQAW